MEETSGRSEICPVGEGFILRKLEGVRRQFSNTADPVMHRMGLIPHGLEAGLARVILQTEETTHSFLTAQPAVLRDFRRLGETGTKRALGVQVKERRVNKGLLKAHPEPLLWVAIDPSALPREA